MPVGGFISSRSPNESASAVAAFRQGLTEVGYVEGDIAFRWAEGQYDRPPALAADLARRQVAVIFATGGNPPAFAAKAATATIPIVFITGSDPVEVGLVASLNRPGSNVTDVSMFTSLLVAKRLECSTMQKGTSTEILIGGRNLASIVLWSPNCHSKTVAAICSRAAAAGWTFMRSGIE